MSDSRKDMTLTKDLSFEEAFGALEAAVQELEEGELTLAQAITLYERGMQLARHCGDTLDHAELRVRQLAGDGETLESSIAFEEDD